MEEAKLDAILELLQYLVEREQQREKQELHELDMQMRHQVTVNEAMRRAYSVRGNDPGNEYSHWNVCRLPGYPKSA